MANNYIGVNNIARKVKNYYIGVNGKARKVKKMYVGVNGKARLCYEDGPKPRAAYFTFSSPNSFTVAATKKWNGTLEYSTDTYNWTEWDGSELTSVKREDGKYALYFSGTGNTVITGSSKQPWSISNKNVSCANSNIETLLDWETVSNGGHPSMGAYAFASMFFECSALSVGPALLSPVVSNYCYDSMFGKCSSLKGITSQLPAQTASMGCYMRMFSNCTNLIGVPKINATLLYTACCAYMFSGCTKVKISSRRTSGYNMPYLLPNGLNGTISGGNQFIYMFAGTGGTFTGNPVVNTRYYIGDDNNVID